MSVMFGLVLVLAVVLFAAVLWVTSTYNGLISLRNLVDNAWAQIDVQLKRRHDLVPNLVETVKGYAAHERQTFENVIKARSAAMSATGPQGRADAENVLTGALKSLFAVAEAYPELKANQNFLALQQQLTDTEGAIADTRTDYNDCVVNYNNATQMFPANFLAGMFHFEAHEYFGVPAGPQREPVKVQF